PGSACARSRWRRGGGSRACARSKRSPTERTRQAGASGGPREAATGRLLVAQVEGELGGERAQLPERPRLELAHALARDAELAADRLERLRLPAREAEPALEDVLQPRLEPLERGGELGRLQALGGRALRLLHALVLDQVGVQAVAVADGRLQADRVLDQLEKLPHALLGKAALRGDLRQRRVAVQLLRQDPPGPGHAPDLVCDVHREADQPSLVGERARDRLPDPPGRVGGELVPHAVVQLLHRPDQPQVAFLDEVEQGDAGPRVVPRDRHDETEVALDQPPLRRLVARVLAAGELPFFPRRQERAVPDLADVQLQRVAELRLALLVVL